MKRVASILAVLALAGGVWAQDQAPKDTIDMVFCIDCSGSMGGVIHTAKQKVWDIVNEIAKERPKAALRIGLIGYGDADRRYRTFDLSDDLDEVFKNLMTFKDEGWGDEWVGRVIHKAVNELKWTPGRNVLKIIFVVGNETAHQGPAEYLYTQTAAEAIRKDIMVNAIYCAQDNQGETWKEMARLADGRYQEIHSQGGAVSIATPFDKELADLSSKLNTTYVAFGKRGAEKKENQLAQDANAVQTGTPGAPQAQSASRAVAKCAPQYNNSSWDLVDARREKQVDLEKIAEEDLPEEMKKMTVEERKAYVDQKAKEREEIQARIKDLNAKREAFIAEETRKQGLDGDKAFDKAVKETVNKQCESKGAMFGK